MRALPRSLAKTRVPLDAPEVFWSRVRRLPEPEVELGTDKGLEFTWSQGSTHASLTIYPDGRLRVLWCFPDESWVRWVDPDDHPEHVVGNFLLDFAQDLNRTFKPRWYFRVYEWFEDLLDRLLADHPYLVFFVLAITAFVMAVVGAATNPHYPPPPANPGLFIP